MVTEYRLIGGDPALDLANTLEGPIDREPDLDHLACYEDLTAWAVRAGVLDERTAARLAAVARPEQAERALARVHELRDAIYAVFAAVARDRPPERLGELEAAYAAAVARARLARGAGGFTWSWEGDDLDRVLWPIAVAAVDLLRTGPLERVKLCAHCRWLFLDASRNRSRRWCSMNECGGNAKMRRYRARRATAGR